MRISTLESSGRRALAGEGLGFDFLFFFIQRGKK
jgi:hypothetical protein